MYKKISGWIFLAVFFFTGVPVGTAQTTTDASALIEKINNAEKVEHLYTVRYNLDKLSANTNLSMAEMRRVLEVHLILTDEFETRNHFRNAADVYLDYLKLSELFHKNYSKFLVDSVTGVNNAEALNFKNNISKLDTEITSLTKRNEIVSGLRSKYLTYGGIATAIILLIFAITFLSRNKSIRETNEKIADCNQQLEVLFEAVVKSGMLSGAVLYTRSVMNDNVALIDELLENKDAIFGSKSDANALKSLNEARGYFLNEVQVTA